MKVSGRSARSTAVKAALGFLGSTSVRAAFSLTERGETRGGLESFQRKFLGRVRRA